MKIASKNKNDRNCCPELACIIDEVQKVPHVLDEVHWLIENQGINFIYLAFYL